MEKRKRYMWNAICAKQHVRKAISWARSTQNAPNSMWQKRNGSVSLGQGRLSVQTIPFHHNEFRSLEFGSAHCHYNNPSLASSERQPMQVCINPEQRILAVRLAVQSGIGGIRDIHVSTCVGWWKTFRKTFRCVMSGQTRAFRSAAEADVESRLCILLQPKCIPIL